MKGVEVPSLAVQKRWHSRTFEPRSGTDPQFPGRGPGALAPFLAGHEDTLIRAVPVLERAGFPRLGRIPIV